MGKKVLHVIKTVSIANDGRLQKWISFLTQSGYDSDVFILQDDNKPGFSDSYGARVIKTNLSTRRIFPKRKGYLMKIPEYYLKFRRFIKSNRENYNFIIFHDVQQYLNLAGYLKKKLPNTKVVWDLHELPHAITYKLPLVRSVMRNILTSVDCLVYTNVERRDFMLTKFGHREKNFTILNNFPEKTFNFAPVQELPQNVLSWLNGERYILWLGVTNNARNFRSFFLVYSKHYVSEFKLIIIGKVDAAFKAEIEALKEHGRIYNDYVRQEEIINYIDGAYFSVVLYNASSPNNWFCEPNRLYQLINRHIPIIVGSNPTMKSIVIEQNAGVVLADDGTSEDYMHDGFKELLKHYDTYKQSLLNSTYKETHSIETQFEDVIRTLELL